MGGIKDIQNSTSRINMSSHNASINNGSFHDMSIHESQQ